MLSVQILKYLREQQTYSNSPIPLQISPHCFLAAHHLPWHGAGSEQENGVGRRVFKRLLGNSFA